MILPDVNVLTMRFNDSYEEAPSPGSRSHSLRAIHPLPQGEREKKARGSSP